MESATKNGWSETTLGDVAEKIAMGPFGSNIKIETFVDEGVPVISGAHLRGTRLADVDYNFVSREHADRLASANVRRGDVIFTHAGNIGQVAYIPKNSKYDRYILSQRQFYLRPSEHLSGEYLTYYFHSPQGRHQLFTYASQVGVPSISQPVSNLRSTPINLPPIEEQRSIVAVIACLDDKIDLLRRQNETLEQVAQAVFNEWFVKQNTEGVLPKGWKMYRLDELADVVSGYSYKGTDLVESSPVGMVNLKNFDREGGFKTDGLKPIAGSPKAKQEVHLGDVVVAHTDITQDAAVLGNAALILDTGGFERLYISMDVAKIVPKANLTMGFLYFLMRTDAFKQHCVAYANGTTVLHLPRIALPEYEVALPQDLRAQVVSDFDNLADAVIKKLIANVQSMRTLASTRDALLPRLMSGELRIV